MRFHFSSSVRWPRWAEHPAKATALVLLVAVLVALALLAATLAAAAPSTTGRPAQLPLQAAAARLAKRGSTEEQSIPLKPALKSTTPHTPSATGPKKKVNFDLWANQMHRPQVDPAEKKELREHSRKLAGKQLRGELAVAFDGVRKLVPGMKEKYHSAMPEQPKHTPVFVGRTASGKKVYYK
ncbi:hypothetical protein DFJ73DRAFT_797328 [Zopfochytrium polystomum]|nr:hypothetical protein DFJ73DRAFT_797328 [Zopfochytrium polystomum]